MSDTPPEDSEFWVDTGVSPTMLRAGAGRTCPRSGSIQKRSLARRCLPLTTRRADAKRGRGGRAQDAAGRDGRSVTGEHPRISGRESVDVRACGKNLYDVNDRKTFSDGVTVDADGWITVTADNSAGSGTIFKNCYTYPSLAIRPSTQYAVVCEIAQINVTGQLTFSIVDLYNDPQALSQFAQAFSLTVNENTQTAREYRF